MYAFSDRKYKDQMPAQTVATIHSILHQLGIQLLEYWTHTLPGFYSNHLRIANTEIFSNGKGVTPEFALASGYAEFIERLQNQLFSNIQFDPETQYTQGFYLAPDEVYVTCEELLADHSIGMRYILPDDFSPEEKEERLRTWRFMTPTDCRGEYISLPYYDVKADELVYLPASLVDTVYATNGMCAGNTPEEALVQGLSEILERYVNLQIVRKKIIPPTIPSSDLAQFDQICNMIAEIEQTGRYHVIVKDCSLGEGLPVVAVILFNQQDQTYMVKFGAHPSFTIAVERTLTEMLQGQHDICNLFGINTFEYFKEDVETRDNIRVILTNGWGYYPTEFFSQNFSYEFSGCSEITANNNQELLCYLMDVICKKGYTILIRDVSFLGFPSYRILVPGMSENYSLNPRTTEAMKMVSDLHRIAKKLPEATEAEIDLLVQFIQKYTRKHLFFNSLKDMLDLPIDQSFPWAGIKNEFLLPTALYRLERFQEAYEAMEEFLQTYKKDMDQKTQSYYKCARDYMGARAAGWGDDRIYTLLITFYTDEIVTRVISDLHQPEAVFQHYQKLNCWNCAECEFSIYCSYEKVKQIYRNVKARYAENPIDQKTVANIFKGSGTYASIF